MNRLVAFHAPLKSPDDPTPSGDRRMARALIAALDHAGWRAEVASRLRTYDREGDTDRQQRIAALGRRCARRLLERYRRRPAERRPAAWLTYHAYHKSPDRLGPEIAQTLGIPYLIAEASFAPKQVKGPWALGHAASEQAIRAADLVLAVTGRDVAGLRPLITPPAELWRLPPFLDPGPFSAARAMRDAHRGILSRLYGLDPARPWLLTVAMMRADVKLTSYRLLADALGRLQDRAWQLLVIGDGPARRQVEAAMAALGPARVVFAGLWPEDELAVAIAACDLYVWPAVREAYGLAMLEAQAGGLPVVAGREGGVEEVVQDGITGLLAAPGDPAAFAAATAELLDRPERRAKMAARARAFVRRERSLERAGGLLDHALTRAAAINAERRKAP